MRATNRLLASVVLAWSLLGAVAVGAQEPPVIRVGHGFAAEEQLWLMAARPDLTPNQGAKYRLTMVQFQGPTDRMQAYLAGEIDAGTNPGLSLIFARAQGVDVRLVASICREAAGSQWFRTAYMVREDGPVKSAKDLKGATVAVVSLKSATDLWARAGVIRAGLVPDRDVKFVPMAFPAIGPAVRAGKVTVGTFVEPFYSAERTKGGLRVLFDSVEALGYDHELLDIWVADKFIKAHPDAVRAFLADYVAVTKHYLANTTAAKRDLHKAGLVRTPLDLYLTNRDWQRDPDARVDVASLKRLEVFMRETLNWLEKPVDVDALVDLSFLPR
jgi:ABC-type nitrate/sulfonate/bicarbonate transport system substrate-binding protein